eukprot:COSAG02_NODE_1226_length_13781_cov_2000.919828_7_plen_48_part_00
MGHAAGSGVVEEGGCTEQSGSGVDVERSMRLRELCALIDGGDGRSAG